MEKPMYRMQLEMVTKRFGDRLTVPLSEVAEYMGFNQRTLQADKDFPARKVGGRWVVSLCELAHYLAS